MIYKSAVIGLGKIGLSYDCNNESTNVTHSKAYCRHNNFQLVAGVDINDESREQFERNYCASSYSSVDELFSAHDLDVVSIATSTGSHIPILERVIEEDLKAIICEKPFTGNLKFAKEFVLRAKKRGIPILVNYMRRYEPGILSLRYDILENKYGDIYKGVLFYTKGLKNNASHFIDLLLFIIGKVEEVNIISPGRLDLNDPEPDFSLVFANGFKLYAASVDARNYPYNELTLVGTKGVINYGSNGGDIHCRFPAPSEALDGCNYLAEPLALKSDFYNFQRYVLDSLYSYLSTGANLNSTGETSLETLEVVEEILIKLEQYK